MKQFPYESPKIGEMQLHEEGILCSSNDATIDMTPENGIL